MSHELTLLYIILGINIALIFGLRKIVELERRIKNLQLRKK